MGLIRELPEAKYVWLVLNRHRSVEIACDNQESAQALAAMNRGCYVLRYRIWSSEGIENPEWFVLSDTDDDRDR